MMNPLLSTATADTFGEVLCNYQMELNYKCYDYFVEGTSVTVMSHFHNTPDDDVIGLNKNTNTSL